MNIEVKETTLNKKDKKNNDVLLEVKNLKNLLPYKGWDLKKNRCCCQSSR